MELRWQSSFDVSALHAAWATASGRPLIDADLQASLQPAADQLTQLSSQCTIPQTVFWRQLLALAADIPSNEQLAERLLQRVRPEARSSQRIAEFSAAIGACEAAVRRRFPRMLEELALRSGPLQLAWEARGPGLLFMLSQATEPGFVVDSATVLLVQPVVGGDGMAHLATNRVHIECLLTDAVPGLPETLRLAWLLGQLNLDRPFYSDQVHGHALAEVAELALLPALLAAADDIQLARFDLRTLQLALSQWLRVPDDRLDQLASVLMAWWETATASRWQWSTALAALSKMLGDCS